eukprot:233620_1
MTIIFIVIPLILDVIYLIYWMGLQRNWVALDIDQQSGINFHYCIIESQYLHITGVTGAIILLWLFQLSLSITDKNNEYNTKTIMIITTIFVILIPFILFDSVEGDLAKHKAKNEMICIVGFILIIIVQTLIFWTQFYLIWLNNLNEIKPNGDQHEFNIISEGVELEHDGEHFMTETTKIKNVKVQDIKHQRIPSGSNTVNYTFNQNDLYMD